ncbi:fucose permease [Mariniflexile fucanivorans]|uniref:Fucose permease n=1 Tax=Mariniflexile fucanivorans TaxID=264023 RepID=A0A4R1RGJ1_9FLAO|nr:MFS transporter [Mariniflexile fucanivorans]TCL65103.1 fucose permease [Mariniflexile fucanivorans]
MELRNIQRIALSTYFFLSGICFASWASRIPTIKDFFNLNEAELGTILLAMPISSLIGLPFSGWLVSKFDSRVPLIVSFIFFSIALTCIGFATTTFWLVLSVCLFSFSMRILNISVNTQSITIQKKFEKRIVGAFHGLWSTGGLVGVAFSTLMVKMDISMQIHLLSISIFSLIVALITYQFAVKGDISTTGNKLIIGKPDPFILYLGIIIFLAAICEGGMFDWSGVYFKDVVKEEVFTYGYLVFMGTMALSRFFCDRLVDVFGLQKTYILSSLLIASGIAIAIIFPFFWPALLGFCFVGFGTAAIFPVTFSLAGTSKKYSPGMAISIITTYAIAGMLIGPPLIGYLAHAFNLRSAFIIFILLGFIFIPVSRAFFKFQSKQIL